jgi:hypothetical protein
MNYAYFVNAKRKSQIGWAEILFSGSPTGKASRGGSARNTSAPSGVRSL